jgi:hypothetical protein
MLKASQTFGCTVLREQPCRRRWDVGGEKDGDAFDAKGWRQVSMLPQWQTMSSGETATWNKT